MELAQELRFGSHLIQFFYDSFVPCVPVKPNHGAREGVGGVYGSREQRNSVELGCNRETAQSDRKSQGTERMSILMRHRSIVFRSGCAKPR